MKFFDLYRQVTRKFTIAMMTCTLLYDNQCQICAYLMGRSPKAVVVFDKLTPPSSLAARWPLRLLSAPSPAAYDSYQSGTGVLLFGAAAEAAFRTGAGMFGNGGTFLAGFWVAGALIERLCSSRAFESSWCFCPSWTCAINCACYSIVIGRFSKSELFTYQTS